MKKHNFVVIAISILNLFHRSVSSNCIYYEWNSEIDYGSVKCFNMSSEMLFDVENATTIQQLTVDDSSVVKEIPSRTSLSKFTELKKLILASLQIEQISPGAFDKLNQLEDLILANNYLEELHDGVFCNLKKLKTLFLSQNLLKQIGGDTFKNLKNLEVLRLSSNLISNIENNAFCDLVSLRKLDLSENNLTRLQNNLFQNLIKLEVIDLSHNPLEEVQDVGFSSNLDTVNIRNTLLTEWKHNLLQAKITDFTLMKNQLKEFDFAQIATTHSSASIDISQNCITAVKNLKISNFSRIYLNNNFITDVAGIPKNVIHLRLDHNRIKHLEQPSDTSDYKLSTLELNNNEIDDATCFGLSKLTLLDLANNHITVIKKHSFFLCANLHNLDLSFNKIVFLEPGAFEGLEELINLDISNNLLTKLDSAAFRGLNKLLYLYCTNNEISSMDIEAISENMPELTRIQFDFNLLFCDEMHKIFRSLRFHHIYTTEISISNSDCKKRS